MVGNLEFRLERYIYVLGKNIKTNVKKTGCEVVDFTELFQVCLIAGLCQNLGSR
jgi:hypothetical protein